MLEDAVALTAELFRRHRHTHLDVFDFPFSPCTTVHPYAAVVEPLCSGLFLKVDGSHDSVGTLAVSAVWVGKVAGNVNLVRLNLLQKFAYNLHIGLSHRQLFNLARLVERQVKEVTAVERNAVVGAGCACFTTANESLDGAYLRNIHVRRLLLSKELLDFIVHLGDDLVLAVAENLVVAIDEVHETCHFLIADSDVSGCLVGDVYLVVLLYQAADGAAH